MRPSHESIDAILDRARAYRRAGIIRDGVAPHIMLVSDEEYTTLLIYGQSDHDGYQLDYTSTPPAVRLYGMRVLTPQHEQWRGALPCMSHVPSVGPPPMLCSVLDYDPTTPLQLCTTERPAAPCAEWPCPCGEVIWQRTPETWPRVIVPSLWTGSIGHPAIRVVDTETSSDEEWARAVHAMIVEAQQRRAR